MFYRISLRVRFLYFRQTLKNMHKKILFTISLVSIFYLNANSQGYPTGHLSIAYSHCFGGSKDDDMFVASPTLEGGCVVEGYCYSSDGDLTSNKGNADWWVFQLDANNNFLWQHSYGGSNFDKCRWISQNPDGKTVMAFGTSQSQNGDLDTSQIPLPLLHDGIDQWWLLKLSDSGNIMWQKLFCGSGSNGGRSLLNTPDGGYLLCGWSTSHDYTFSPNNGSYDSWLIKLDSLGNTTWKQNYGGSGSDRARVVIKTTDGNWAFTGGSYSNDSIFAGQNHGNNDFMVVKTDTQGHVIWAKEYGGSAADNGYDITLDWDGNYLVCGYDSSSDGDVVGAHGKSDIWVIKVNSQDGSLMWQKPIGGTKNDNGLRVLSMPDHGYIVLGTSNSTDEDALNSGNHGGNDYFLTRMDSNHNIEWTRSFGGSKDEEANDIFLVKGGYYIWGRSTSFDGDLANAGHHGADTGTNYDLWGLIVKDSDLTTGVQKVLPDFNYSLYPTATHTYINFNGRLYYPSNMTLTVIDALGKVQKTIFVPYENLNFTQRIDVADLPKGAYFLKAQSAGYTATKQFLVQ
jgi:hypothetical protein